MATMTAAQRRRCDRVAYQATMELCPTRDILARLGEKWVALIVKELAPGPRRHAELARCVAGASQKMLTQTLRVLERDGLVAREVAGAVPARVDYALTPLGRSLLPVLDAVTQWSERHLSDLTAARLAYDARSAASPPTPPSGR